jgi:gamma-glutamyltranspeptidase/glutathione hydrolase
MKYRRKRKIRLILTIVAIIVFSLLVHVIVSNWVQKPTRVTERPAGVSLKSGMVASANPHATKVGVEILKKGGNAVDAAVATAFALGVVEPFASGIGGGGFMLIYAAKSKQIVTIDYREMAPLKATPKMYMNPSGQVLADRMKEGHMAVAIPGTLAGLSLALSKYGTMSLKVVMEPAIELGENGFEVSRLLSSLIESNSQKLSKFPASARIYLKEGLPYKVGDRLFLKDLASTYRLIAKEGPQVFYKGAIAETIEKEMKSGKGLITREDLAAYRPVLRSPVKGSYRGYEVFSMGPPSSGGTHVIELLNIFEGQDMGRLGLNTYESIRLMSEAMKRVFSEREKYMGDPDFVKVPIEDLLSKEHARTLGREMSTGKVIEKRGPGYLLAYGSDQTTHISIVDAEGNLVALTQTINSFFGSGVVVPGTGILLNNEMNDFIPKEGSPNSIKPRKRPVSNMSPTLVLKDGKPYMTIGMPGATRIITVLPQILMNIIDHKMTMQKAIDAPRIHCEAGKEIFIESRIPKEVQDGLIRNGYKLVIKKDFDLYFGGTQAVMIDPKTGKPYGGADPRREGSVMGY